MKKNVNITIAQGRSVTTFFNRVLENFERKFDGFPALLDSPRETPSVVENSDPYANYNPQDIIDAIAQSVLALDVSPCPDREGGSEGCIGASSGEAEECLTISSSNFNSLDLDTSWEAYKSVSTGTVFTNPVNGTFVARLEWEWSDTFAEDIERRVYMSYHANELFQEIGPLVHTAHLTCKLQRSASELVCDAQWELYAGNWGTNTPSWDNPGVLIASGFVFAGDGEVDVDVSWHSLNSNYAQFVFVNKSLTGKNQPLVPGPAGCSPRGTPTYPGENYPHSELNIRKNGTHGYSICAVSAGTADCTGEIVLDELIYNDPSWDSLVEVHHFIDVTFDGVKAVKDVDYTVSGNSITPTGSLDANTIVMARYTVR